MNNLTIQIHNSNGDVKWPRVEIIRDGIVILGYTTTKATALQSHMNDIMLALKERTKLNDEELKELEARLYGRFRLFQNIWENIKGVAA